MPLRRPLAALLFAGLIVLSGCSSGGEDPTPEEGSTSESQEATPDELTPPEADLEGVPEVVAEVNGETIDKEQFVATFQGFLHQMFMMSQGQEIDQGELKSLVVDQLVDNLLLTQAAEEAGITASDSDVDEALEDLAAQNGIGSVEEVLDLFAEQGISEAIVREDAAAQVKIDAFLSQEVTVEEPDEEELTSEYEEFVEMLKAQDPDGSQEDLPSFDEVRDLMVEQAAQEQKDAALQGILQDLHAEADITIHL